MAEKGIISDSNNGFNFCVWYGRQLSEKLRKCLRPYWKETSASGRVYENLSADCHFTALHLVAIDLHASFQSSPKINRMLITRLTLARGLTTEQINKTCQTVYYHLHNIRQIRKLLTPASTKRLVRGVIMARIYYCNGVLY